MMYPCVREPDDTTMACIIFCNYRGMQACDMLGRGICVDRDNAETPAVYARWSDSSRDMHMCI